MRLIDADKLRKDVLDLPNCYNGFSDTYDKAMVIDLVDEQPTVDAEPIRHGEWFFQEYVDGYYCTECSECGEQVDHDAEIRGWKYCPKCGAMMGEWEEPEINPCRGCTDYDGRGGCKSNGGCGAKMEVE